MAIKTRFSENTDRKMPLAEYPRPQLVREKWLCLNGEYDFAVCPAAAAAPSAFSKKILVPFASETALSGIEQHPDENQKIWYRRNFTLPGDFTGFDILLHFEAVDWRTEVFVNGKAAGTHEGGYNPFYFNITELLQDGENELLISAYDPTDSGEQARGKQTHKTHGFWYTATSGIWQTVWLEPVPKNYIKSVKLTPDIDKKKIRFALAQSLTEKAFAAFVYDGENLVASGEFTKEGELEIPDMKLWSPESPFLYDIIFRTSDDEVKSYFGMRKFSIEKDTAGIPRLCLNGAPYFQRGLLDQGYFCEGGLTPPTDEAMIYDIKTMKELGFNMLRKHIKRENNRWYYHCDRLGMLVWQDMISGGDYVSTLWCGVCPNIGITSLDDTGKNRKKFKRSNPVWRETFKKELFEMIDGLYNSPAICCWVPFNESWGQFDAKEIGLSVKKYDATRFVDHASGWHDRGGPDFVSVHKYIMPVTCPKNVKNKTEKRPFVLSEYGGYSRKLKDHDWNYAKSFGYMMYNSEKTLTDAFVKLHEKQIIPLIEKGLSATVYTQVSDVEWEVNGMLSYDRQIVKLTADEVKKVNSKLKY